MQLFPLMLLSLLSQSQSSVDAGRILVFEDSLQRAESLEQFWMTEPREWSFQGHVADDGLGNPVVDSGPCIAFKSGRSYQPRVRSPHSFALLRGVSLCPGFAFEVEAMQTGVETPHRDLVLVFGFQSPERFYYAHLGMIPDEHSSNVFTVNRAPRAMVGDVATKEIDWGRGVWHQLRVECDRGGRARIFVDDMESPVFDKQLPHSAAGGIGFGSFDDAGAFRNLKVWQHEMGPGESSPEPWHSSPFGSVVEGSVVERDETFPVMVSGVGPKAFRSFDLVVAGETHYATVHDADDDGHFGTGGDLWTVDRAGGADWHLPGDLYPMKEGIVVEHDVLLRAMGPASPGPQGTIQFQTTIPTRSRSDFARADFVRRLTVRAPAAVLADIPWDWTLPPERYVPTERPTLYALTTSDREVCWSWERDVFSSRAVQELLSKAVILQRLDYGRQRHRLVQEISRVGHLPALVLLDRDGKVVAHTSDLSSPRVFQAWLEEALSAAEPR